MAGSEASCDTIHRRSGLQIWSVHSFPRGWAVRSDGMATELTMDKVFAIRALDLAPASRPGPTRGSAGAVIGGETRGCLHHKARIVAERRGDQVGGDGGASPLRSGVKQGRAPAGDKPASKTETIGKHPPSSTALPPTHSTRSNRDMALGLLTHQPRALGNTLARQNPR